MAFLPIGPSESQETMFEESSSYAATEEYEAEEFAERDLEVVADHPEPELEPELKFGHGGVSGGVTPSAAAPEPALKTVPEAQPEVEQQSSADSGANTGVPALSTDDFSALEERVVRAVSLVRRERVARLSAEERALKAEAQLEEQSWSLDRVTQLQQEVDSLRLEREQVRQRVERLLSQLDALEV